MLNTIKFSLRVLLKNKLFSALNIFGLTFGLTAALWLLLFLQNELSYDRHIQGHENIYRVSHILSAPGVEFNTAFSATELSPLLKERYPEVESYARFSFIDNPEIVYKTEVFLEVDKFFTDASAVEIFDLELETGSNQQPLSQPGSTIVSSSLAKKVFGNKNAIGEVLSVQGNEYLVSGIFKDLPKNTHFKFNMLISGIGDREFAFIDGVLNSEALWNANCLNYIRFQPNTSIENFKQKFSAFNEEFYMPFGNQINGNHKLRLQALADIHYDKATIDDDFAKGNPTNLVVFSMVGLAILFLACINYINLSTARAGLRAKEIGIRKVLGSNIEKLRLALLSESLLQVAISYFLSLFLTWTVIHRSPLQAWLGTDFSFDLFSKPELLFTSILVVLITGLLAGLYPAAYLSKIKAVSALKGTWSVKSGHMIRQGLVLFQFVISIGVLISALLMKDQLEFIAQKDIGLAKDEVLIINSSDSTAQTKLRAIKDAFLANPGIVSVTSSDYVAGSDMGQIVFKVDRDGEMKQQEFKTLLGDEDYLETFGIPLVDGRTFSGTETRGNQYFVINETAAKNIGWEDPIGKKLGFFHQEEPGQVIGVVKDFNMVSLHNPIEPMVFVFDPSPGRNLIVKFQQQQMAEALKAIQTTWEELLPNYPLEYSFLNQRLSDQYAADETQNKLISAMTILCIVISLIGLTGLTSFNIDQRKKEIGVRKVLGAYSFQIVRIVFQNTLKLIAIAGIIATPLAYLAVTNWSNNFQYQTSVNVLLIGISIASCIGLTFALVSGLVFKAASKNPVDTLRYE